MKKNRQSKKALPAVLLLVCLLISSLGTSVYAAEKTDNQGAGAAQYGSVEVGSRFRDLFFGKGDDDDGEKTLYLCPVGDAFGVKICGVGVSVSGVISDTAQGYFCIDDKITSINGKEISTVEEVRKILSSVGGAPLLIELTRGERQLCFSFSPESAGDSYHLGVTLKDSASGIGTVTYLNSKTGEFGGLGHGISADGKELFKMTRGTATGVILAGASRGERGKPGELRGVLTDKSIGTISSNTECGVFGSLSKDGIDRLELSEAIPVAAREDVHTGSAKIISTVKSGMREEYDIEIVDIDYSSSGNKSFRIHVTDPDLIALTGGIVRGMSGSPIIQDGKLVGAVTHVLVANPTEGYGIFIENMLNAAQDQVIPKAA